MAQRIIHGERLKVCTAQLRNRSLKPGHNAAFLQLQKRVNCLAFVPLGTHQGFAAVNAAELTHMPRHRIQLPRQVHLEDAGQGFFFWHGIFSLFFAFFETHKTYREACACSRIQSSRDGIPVRYSEFRNRANQETCLKDVLGKDVSSKRATMLKFAMTSAFADIQQELWCSLVK